MSIFPKKSQYPNCIHIGDSIWLVKFVNNLPDHSLGLCDPSINTIFIRTKQTKEETFKTFVHEVLHCYEFEEEIEIPHKIIDQFEIFFADFFLKNFWAFSKRVE